MQSQSAEDPRYQEWATEIVEQLRRRSADTQRQCQVCAVVVTGSVIAYIVGLVVVISSGLANRTGAPPEMAVMDAMFFLGLPWLGRIRRSTRTLSEAYDTGLHNANYRRLKGDEQGVCFQYGWALTPKSRQALRTLHPDGPPYLDAAGF